MDLEKEKNDDFKKPTIEEPENSSEVMESLLETVGGFGRWQWFLFFITSFAGVFGAFNNVSAAFLAASPEHWCRHPGINNDSIEPLKEILNSNTSHVIFPKCKYYDVDYDVLVNDYWREGRSPKDDNIKEKPCTEWIFDDSEFESTITMEWNLVCENRWLMSTVQSSSVLGFLAGGIVFSELSDMYGRRTLSLISVVGLTITGIATAFSNTYALFISLRFLMSCFMAGIFLPNFVILMESSGEKARTYLGVMYQGIFGLAVVALAVLAYFFNSWRKLELALFIPCLILFLYFKILPESPRWLLEQGRQQEAGKVLRSIAKGNKKEIDEAKFKRLISSFQQVETKSHNILKVIALFFMNQMKLFKTPILRRRCMLIFFEWFTVGLVYYGLVFNSPNLEVSRFLLVAAGGFSEALSVIVVSFTVQKFGRRINLMGLFLICGISCIGILFVAKKLVWLNLTLSTIGKFANAAAFAVAYIYSAELVPTDVRNIAVGGSSMWARIGSICAPYIVDLLGELHYAIPSTVFGILSVVAALAALLLPETGGKRLPDSVQEIEMLKK